MSWSGHRAAARIAWRQAWRAPWRSALVMAMVVLPIAGLSAAAVGIRSARPTPEERVRAEMGAADLSIDGGRKLKAPALAGALPEGSQLVGLRSKTSQYVVGATFNYFNVEELSVPIDAEIARGLFVLLDGRAPANAGEAAIQPDAMREMGVAIGDDLELPDGFRVRVTGAVAAPESLDSIIMVVGPGTFGGAGRPPRYLVDLPDGQEPEEAKTRARAVEGVRSVLTRDEVARPRPELEPDQATVTNWAFVATALALFGTGLIASAAFIVGTKRRLRTLGLIGAVGGEPRHVRSAVLFGGVVLGAAGASVGVMFGIVAVYLGRGLLDKLAGRMVGSVGIPMSPLVGAIALGTVAATCAAFVPARMAARLSTIQALAGHTPPPRAPGKVALIGLIGVGVGTALTAHGTVVTSDAELTVGLIASVGGFLLAIPLLVMWVGKLVPRLPLSPRLAGRDIARNARRTGSALAAATIALSVPVALAAVTLSDEAYAQHQQSLAPDHVLVDTLPTADPAQLNDALVSDLEASLPGWDIAPLRVAVYPIDREAKARYNNAYSRVAEVRGSDQTTPESRGVYRPFAYLFVGGPEILRAFHAEDGIPALLDGKVVAVGPGFIEGGTVTARRQARREGGNGDPVKMPAVEAGNVSYRSPSGGDFTLVMTAETAVSVGLRASRAANAWTSQIVLRAPEALSEEQIRNVKEIVSEHPGAYAMSAEDFVDDGGRLVRLWGSVGGAILALGIVGVAVALIAAESRRDQAIMVAVGASPATRRRLAGMGAWMVALLAGVLAVPSGWLPVAVSRSVQPQDYPVVVPWIAIATALLLVPAIAGLFGWALSRRPTASRLLRPIA